MSKPFFILCNDDGVHAPGIRVLAEHVAAIGDVVIVAPHVERSASSQAISTSVPLRVEQVEENVYGVEGYPADCVMVAIRSLVKRQPDWILSGINRGGNLGTDTLYSGTVGAALEARLHGIRAMAISSDGAEPLRYDTAAQVAVKLLQTEGMDQIDGVVNVNVPNVSYNELKGMRSAGPGRRNYDQFLVENVDPRGRPYYWLGGGGSTYADIPGSDCLLVDEGYVAVSVLKPDLFDRQATEDLKLPSI